MSFFTTLEMSDDEARPILAAVGLRRHCALTEPELATLLSSQGVNAAGSNHPVAWDIDDLREYIRR